MVEKKRSVGKIIGITILCIFVLFLFSGACFVFGLITGSVDSSRYISGGSIYEIRLEGVISASKYSGLFGEASVTPEEIIGKLKAAQEDSNVKAILIRVNSPGGSAAASQEIYEELKKVEKPVVVSVSDICASGAYYVACAADKIVANRSSSVGSIGVIMQITNLEELYEKIGIKYTTIKQGKYKDVGSPDRPLTAEEKKMLEDQTKEIYQQFISDVAESRGMNIDKVRELATGWVFIGSEAIKLGLIDEVGTYNDAIKLASELGGIEGEPNIISEEEASIWNLILKYYFGLISGKILNLQYSYYPIFK